MSLKGQINKVNGDFFSAVRNASLKGNIDSEGGMHGTRKVIGYVCKVHSFDDENEDLRGTVDVQEFGYEPGEDKYEGAGYHEGVKCSAIQPNKNGIYLMPSMYSDVVIVQDPISMEEYVMMHSHVDMVQMQSHTAVKVGVVETEAFEEGDDTPDIDDLEETGNAAFTEYSKDKILHIVKTKDGNITIKQSAENIEVTAKNATITISAEGNITLSAKQVEVKGGSFISKGKANLDGNGGFCGIPVCPFTGATHTGSTIKGG